MRNRFHRLIFKIHSYTGIVSGIALLLIGISGSILVFSHELESFVYNDLLVSAGNGSRISLDSALVIARNTFPEMDFVGFNELPQSHQATFQFFMMDDGIQYKAFIDPFTGTLLHSGERYDHIADWLLIFHYTFAVPVWGDLAVAVLSITMIISLLTGIVVYRKYIGKVLQFKVKFDFKNWRKGSSSLHRIIGVWSLLFMLMMAITAFLMMKYAFTETNFDREHWKFKSGPIHFSIDKTLEGIKKKYPSYHAVEFFLPTQTDSLSYIAGYIDEPSFLFGDYNDQIIFDGKNFQASFVSDKPNAEKFSALIFPLHSGHYGGMIVKIVYCISGFIPGILCVTGILLWLRRKKNR
ncbi:PepSY-associated TM helix domain-containing protein [Pseudochryseolinea flava]|uniref:PepSY domain-containing protein n=1 Tax=Pseudochryseolinea flava TaxID=2059302 RepID=A0A364Y492_9BACT|nr:PepSY-associated TM helix domain-containing protein [Pseudochryseolinea flava]RAW01174.1 hypothetical protein DQQ10_09670 [Pseudochryseolinea flava]